MIDHNLKMGRGQIKIFLTKILSEQLSLDESKIFTHSNISKLGADSLDVIELLLKVEIEYDINIPDAEADAIFGEKSTISSIADYLAPLNKKRREKLKQLNKL
jgi:acyl carrier protein